MRLGLRQIGDPSEDVSEQDLWIGSVNRHDKAIRDSGPVRSAVGSSSWDCRVQVASQGSRLKVHQRKV